MKLLELVRRESTVSIGRMAFLAGLAGLSNASLLAIINVAVGDASNSEHSVREAVLFAIAITIYVISQRHVMLEATGEIEEVLNRIRVRIADKIRHCDLRPLEEIGRASIYSSIQKQTTTISQSAIVLVISAQFAVLIFFTALYVAWLSKAAFVLTAVSVTLVALVFLRRGKQLRARLRETIERENDLYDSLTHQLEGFKETRMNSARGNELFERFKEISDSASSMKIRTQADLSSQFIFSQVAFYLMLAVVVFIVPRLSSTFSETISSTATAILFMIGPISGLVGSIPNLATANAACEDIERLEALLDASTHEPPAPQAAPPGFHEISFEDVVFSYNDRPDSRQFTVGPINLKISAGEMLFISGGNGTGKSTLLKLLTALYYPMQGVVCLDGEPVDISNREAYRSLFSVVFTDYHLFDRLYGLADIDPGKIAETIRYLELTGKTRVVDSEFETLDLSGGQRKRLALLVSLLEDRQIVVYDEVAADQDPVFRRKYYEEILPALQRQGKTIVAVTHDDRYFSAADRLLKMEAGRIVANDTT